jgi:hypothetical protein
MYFRKFRWYEPKVFFLASLIVLNIPVLIWLYCKHGYISGRHILPLVIFTIFYVPIGLQSLSNCFSDIFCGSRPKTKGHPQLWFFILVTAGLAICIPKLAEPTRIEKQSYRAAARWLAEHSDEKDIVAVPDNRISFYAQRKGLEYSDGQIPEQAQYIVKIIKKESNKTPLVSQLGKAEYEYADEKNDKISIAIYRKL